MSTTTKSRFLDCATRRPTNLGARKNRVAPLGMTNFWCACNAMASQGVAMLRPYRKEKMPATIRSLYTCTNNSL
jgi:hypothetical protein